MKLRPTHWLAAIAAFVFFAAAANAQDPLPRKELDKRLELSLFEITKIGTDLYNRSRNEEGCYHIYEGALRTAVTLLDHRAELQSRVTNALKQAAVEPPPQRSFTLREAIEDIRKAINPKAAAMPRTPAPVAPRVPAPAPAPAKSLWDRLGGEAVIRKLVKEAGEATGADPKVNISRNG